MASYMSSFAWDAASLRMASPSYTQLPLLTVVLKIGSRWVSEEKREIRTRLNGTHCVTAKQNPVHETTIVAPQISPGRIHHVPAIAKAKKP
jgi:hypothetical protein